MSDGVTTLAPLFAFMLIPLWIPLIAIAVGAAFDLVERARFGRQTGLTIKLSQPSVSAPSVSI